MEKKSNYDIVQEWLIAFGNKMDERKPYVITPVCEWYTGTTQNTWIGDSIALIKCDDGNYEPAICEFPSYQIIDANWLLEKMDINDPIKSLVHLPDNHAWIDETFWLHIGF